jgi:predicted metal-binding protein
MLQKPQNIYSIEDSRKKKDILSELSEIGRKYNINEIIPLKIEDISIAPWVRLKCKYGCSKYGKSWCCPPETPDPEKMQIVLDGYREALLLCGTITNGDFYRENRRKRRIQVNTWKGTLALERRLLLFSR